MLLALPRRKARYHDEKEAHNAAVGALEEEMSRDPDARDAVERELAQGRRAASVSSSAQADHALRVTGVALARGTTGAAEALRGNSSGAGQPRPSATAHEADEVWGSFFAALRQRGPRVVDWDVQVLDGDDGGAHGGAWYAGKVSKVSADAEGGAMLYVCGFSGSHAALEGEVPYDPSYIRLEQCNDLESLALMESLAAGGAMSVRRRHEAEAQRAAKVARAEQLREAKRQRAASWREERGAAPTADARTKDLFSLSEDIRLFLTA